MAVNKYGTYDNDNSLMEYSDGYNPIEYSKFTQPWVPKGVPELNILPEDVERTLFIHSKPEDSDNKVPEGYTLNYSPETKKYTVTTDNKSNKSNKSNKTYSIKTGTNTKPERISKRLQRKLGLTPEQAAGILAHINGESRFNEGSENLDEKAGKNSAVKSNEYGIGLMQWTGSRHNDFTSYVNTHGGKADIDTQIDFMADEIRTKYGNFLSNLKKTRTPEEAATLAYLQYVGGNKKYDSSEDIDSILDKANPDAEQMSLKYQQKHREMGYKVRDTYTERLNDAKNFVFAKQGGLLKRI